MTENQITRILNRVCTRLGFCLPPDEKKSLAQSGILEEKTLADEICIREGLDPGMVDRNLHRQILTEIRNETNA